MHQEEVPSSLVTEKRIGNELREIRLKLRLSLKAAAALTNREFGASVLGAYERAERSISAERLFRLCAYYGLSLSKAVQIFEPIVSTISGEAPPRLPGYPINYHALQELARVDNGYAVLLFYVDKIAAMRSAVEPTIRLKEDDAGFIGAALGVDNDRIWDELGRLGLLPTE